MSDIVKTSALTLAVQLGWLCGVTSQQLNTTQLHPLTPHDLFTRMCDPFELV